VNITINEIGATNVAPSNLNYATLIANATSIAYAVGSTVNLAPHVIGTVTSYTVSPSLPVGLSMNAITGVISGTPSEVTPAANYLVTASNSYGSTSFIVNVIVETAITIDPQINAGTPIVTCENTTVDYGYLPLSGTATQYKMTFDAAAIAAGIKNISYTNLPAGFSAGSLSFAVPDGVQDGIYHGTLQFRDALGVESVGFPFQFTVNVSINYIIHKFDDVVLCDNSSNRFTAYQWYKNGVAIDGATAQFYCDPEGLVGLYSVQVTTVDGQKLNTCQKDLNTPLAQKIKVYPNPVKSSQKCTVKLIGFNVQELENSVLTIFDIAGNKVYFSDNVSQSNLVDLPVIAGIYIGHVTTSNGTDRVFKVIVKE